MSWHVGTKFLPLDRATPLIEWNINSIIYIIGESFANKKLVKKGSEFLIKSYILGQHLGHHQLSGNVMRILEYRVTEPSLSSVHLTYGLISFAEKIKHVFLSTKTNSSQQD